MDDVINDPALVSQEEGISDLSESKEEVSAVQEETVAEGEQVSFYTVEDIIDLNKRGEKIDPKRIPPELSPKYNALEKHFYKGYEEIADKKRQLDAEIAAYKQRNPVAEFENFYLTNPAQGRIALDNKIQQLLQQGDYDAAAGYMNWKTALEGKRVDFLEQNLLMEKEKNHVKHILTNSNVDKTNITKFIQENFKCSPEFTEQLTTNPFFVEGITRIYQQLNPQESLVKKKKESSPLKVLPPGDGAKASKPSYINMSTEEFEQFVAQVKSG